MSKTIRVLHVEDYKIMRDGVKYLLEQDPEIKVIAEASNEAEMKAALENSDPDVAILDVYLDAMEDLGAKNGIQLCEYITKHYPRIRVIIHSTYDDANRVSAALSTGAKGFVSKRSGFDTLRTAVHEVYAGRKYICAETSKRMRNLSRFLLGVEDQLRDRDEVFTHREREVLELMIQGKSSKEIAEALSIAERTVESHRKNMIEKAEVNNTPELIAYAAARGIIKHEGS